MRLTEYAGLMQKPSIGRIVIVPANPDLNNGATEAPAVITRVWSDELINVKVLGDNDGVEWRTSVKLHEEKPEDGGHVAWWPPRV